MTRLLTEGRAKIFMVAALKVHAVGAAYIKAGKATEGVASTHINAGLGIIRLKEKRIISGRGEGRTSEEAKA